MVLGAAVPRFLFLDEPIFSKIMNHPDDDTRNESPPW